MSKSYTFDAAKVEEAFVDIGKGLNILSALPLTEDILQAKISILQGLYKIITMIPEKSAEGSLICDAHTILSILSKVTKKENE